MARQRWMTTFARLGSLAAATVLASPCRRPEGRPRLASVDQSMRIASVHEWTPVRVVAWAWVALVVDLATDAAAYQSCGAHRPSDLERGLHWADPE